jgi:hypothetical protein|tara:strand:- start:2848 stop:3240 length:393 start_codon:yes stop_codon:yes gene_type:complete
MIFTELLNSSSRRIHSVAHPTTHPANSREVCGIGQIFFSEDVRDNDIEGKTRDAVARMSIEDPPYLARACFDVMRRVDGHRGQCDARASLLVCRAFSKMRSRGVFSLLFFDFQFRKNRTCHPNLRIISCI